MVRIAVIGDSVRDSWIELESDRDLKEFKYSRLSDNYSFGGTALTWTQYLVPEHSVTPITIIGNDEFSIGLEEVLRKLDASLKEKHKPSLDFSGLIKIDGNLAKFILVFSKEFYEKKGRKEWRQKIFWEVGVSDQYDKLNITPDFLRSHDVLALPIPHPNVALQAIRNFRQVNANGAICYNPGRYLERKDYTFKETHFEEIAAEATYLVLNRHENGIVRKKLRLKSTEELFTCYPRLNTIILTKDQNGSEILDRRTGKKYEPNGINVIQANPARSLGAGDAYAATWLSKVLSGQTIDDALDCATKAAESILAIDGALNLNRITNGNYHSPTVKVTSL